MMGNMTEIKNKLSVKTIENEKLASTIKELEFKLSDKTRLNEEARKYAELNKKYEQALADLQSARVEAYYF